MPTLRSRAAAEQALQGQSLQGKKAIVTGANSGLGVETARVLALAGADVMLACRSLEAGEQAANRLRSMLPSGAGKLEAGKLDLSDLRSVKSFTDGYLASGSALDLLINNAGIMASPLGTTAQGFELQMGTNHIGHFHLTKLLRPLLEKSSAARIVTVSSESWSFYIVKMLERFTPYALAILRIIAALLFMQHGLQKLLLFPGPSEHGTPEPWTLVWFGGWIEAAGGALLAVGLFTRVVAFVTAGEMAVAYWMVHAPASFYPVLNHGEPAILFCFVFLLFVFAGHGAWNLDGFFSKGRKPNL